MNRWLFLMALATVLPPAVAEAHDGMTLSRSNDVRIDVDVRAVARDDEAYAWQAPGFMAGGEIGPDARGLSLAHAGAALRLYDADTGLYGLLEASGHGSDHHGSSGGGIELEQAWGAREFDRLTVLVGRQFAPLGMRNTAHGVAATFPEASLAYRVFLGDHYLDDGIALRWRLGPQWSLGAGAWRGAFPAGGIDADGNDAVTAHLDGHFMLAGGGRVLTRLSVLAAQAALRYDERFEPGHSHDPFTPAPVLTYFSGDSTLGVASLQWFSAGSTVELLGEYFARRESGDVRNLTQQAGYDGDQSGLQAEILWMPATNWKLGLRHVALTADNALTGPGAATLASQSGLATAGNPAETALVLERRLDARQLLRLQVIDAGAVRAGDTLLLQYAWQWQRPLSENPATPAQSR